MGDLTPMALPTAVDTMSFEDPNHSTSVLANLAQFRNETFVCDLDIEVSFYSN